MAGQLCLSYLCDTISYVVFLLLLSYLIVSVVCWFSRLLNNAFIYHHGTFCDKIYRHLIVLICGS